MSHLASLCIIVAVFYWNKNELFLYFCSLFTAYMLLPCLPVCSMQVFFYKCYSNFTPNAV